MGAPAGTPAIASNDQTMLLGMMHLQWKISVWELRESHTWVRIRDLPAADGSLIQRVVAEHTTFRPPPQNLWVMSLCAEAGV
jgi:hypothetical protein